MHLRHAAQICYFYNMGRTGRYRHCRVERKYIQRFEDLTAVKALTVINRFVTPWVHGYQCLGGLD
jgi:hypothetical protein